MGFGSVFFPTGSYTVTRTGRGTVANGRYTPGATSTFTITADVQDVSGDHLRDLPEGVRSEDVKIVFTTAELIAHSTTVDGDVISIEGDNYRVIRLRTARVFARRCRALVERIRP